MILAFSLLKSTPQILRHLVCMISYNLVSERFQKKSKFYVSFFLGHPVQTGLAIQIVAWGGDKGLMCGD